MSDHAMQRPRVACRRLAVPYTRRLQANTREASQSCDGAPIEERWAVALASRRPPRHGTSRAPATRRLASSTAEPSPPSIGREAILSTSGGDAPRRVRGGDDEAGATADQRREDDVRVSDDRGRQRNRRVPLAR